MVFFNEDVHRAQAQCMCAGDENCLCPGCIDHPRNAATMEEVMDALNYQQSDDYQELGNLGFDMNDPFLLPNGIDGTAQEEAFMVPGYQGLTGLDQINGAVEAPVADASAGVDPKATLVGPEPANGVEEMIAKLHEPGDD